jgi:cytochrome c-type biogenesis protein CcmH
MQVFLIIIASLTLIAIAFIVPPLLKKIPSSTEKNTPTSDVDRNAMNVNIYKERLAELEQENLTTEQLAQAKQELEKTLAQDLASAESGISNQASARWVTSILVAIAIPVLALGSYWKLGSWELLTKVEAQTTTESNAALTNSDTAEFNEIITKLAARLETQPDDLQGWRMLARSYAVIGDYAKTVQTYNKIMAKFEDQPDVLSDYAEFLAQSNQGKFTGLPTQLLKTALRINPKHGKSLWFLGRAAMERSDYEAAVSHWQALLIQLPPNETKIREVLENQIAKAREHIQGNIPAPVAKQNPEVKKVSKIEVQVNLAPDLQDKIKPNDTLFIYARATKGSPMPLAILRKSASELPITVTLDDSMAMMPTKNLSSVPEITVIARISSSGGAMLQSGDLLGELTPVVLSQQNKIKITIDRVAP